MDWHSQSGQLAPSAFLASAAGSSDRVHQILPPHFQDMPNPFIDSALTASHVGHDKPPPSSIVVHKQKAWDVPRIISTYDMLLEASPNLNTRTRLLTVATRESVVWLNVLLVSSLGLHMDNDVIRVAVGLRLGAPLCEPHHCLHCQAEVDSLGTHGLSCRYSKECHSCHGTLNEEIKKALGNAKIPSHLEPSGLYGTDGKRPDGASIVPWKGGKVLVYTCTRVWACVTSSDTNTVECRCGQYSVTNCRCDVGLSLVSAMFPPSIFEDQCADLRRSMIDVSTFEDRCVDFRSTYRPSETDASTFEDR